MRFIKMLPLLLALGLSLGASAQQSADTNQPPTNSLAVLPGRTERVLTLAQCINLALSNNLDIQIQSYNPAISQFTLSGSYSAYDPSLSLSASKSYNSQPGNINVNTNLNFGSSTTETESFSGGLTGALPSGLTYDFNAPLNKTSQSSSFGATPTTWSSSDFGFTTLKQPLLKNLWIDQPRETIKLNKASLKISEQALRLQIMTTITAVKTAYFNLIFARGSVEADARALQLAQQLASENKTKVEIGTLAPLDEKQAESQAAASQAALLAAQHALVTQENTLKALLTDDYAKWYDIAPVPSQELVAVPQTLDLQESWRRALSQRPEVIQAELNAEKQNITLKFTYNQLYPELDLTGSYGRNALSTSLDTTLNNLRDGRNETWSYGVGVTFPLGNVAARNNYKSAKASVKQVLLQLKQQRQDVVVAIQNDIGQVQSTFEQVKSTHEARLYAEDALKAEQTKLENGKSTSFNVLQLISNLTTARVNEIQALANYNIAQAQLDQDEGSTIEANGLHPDFKVR